MLMLGQSKYWSLYWTIINFSSFIYAMENHCVISMMPAELGVLLNEISWFLFSCMIDMNKCMAIGFLKHKSICQPPIRMVHLRSWFVFLYRRRVVLVDDNYITDVLSSTSSTFWLCECYVPSYISLIWQCIFECKCAYMDRITPLLTQAHQWSACFINTRIF